MYHHSLIDAATPVQAGEAPQLVALIDRALRSLDEDPPLARRYLEYLSRLLGRPDSAAQPVLLPVRLAAAAGANRGGLAGWQLRRVADHVEARLHEPLATEELAEIAQLSTGHFCRAFKASMGETPHAYVMRQRVRRAQMLMLDSADSLSQIAYACGLADQAHLTRLFRRLVGTTPLLWRRTWQQGA